ncbi:MAG: hypothetical protein LBN27_12225 [Prevotellaceae bacterium]|jgi:hypothetical protein|nr:hypothetical protein [Prevotellaceae bacterium]
MKEIESVEEALAATGNPAVLSFSDVPEDKRSFFQNIYKATAITEAINDGWKADWTDPDQKKWIPVFRVDKTAPSGFVFVFADCVCSFAFAGYAARLCFESKNAAIFGGENFTEIFVGIIMG